MPTTPLKTKRTRPLSPHISIYKPQITSVLSILHRTTGVALFVGLLALLWIFIFFIYTPDSANSFLWHFLSGGYGKALIVLWSYSLFFHACSGIRHLCWDMGYGFGICTATKSGWLVVVASIALTIGCWSVVFLT